MKVTSENTNFEKEYELWNKPNNIDFTEEEISFLKEYIKNQSYRVKYGFYSKKSSQGKQISVIFDLMPKLVRKSGASNNWEILYERELSDLEIMEYILFYFRSSYKRFIVFYYSNVERLVQDEIRLGVDTPLRFISECNRRGYNLINKN